MTEESPKNLIERPNPEHLKIVLKGAGAIKKWRREHPNELFYLVNADLSEANLSGLDLSTTNLYGAKLENTDLSGAKLTEAVLVDALFYNTKLLRVDLRGAMCHRASFIGTDLCEAKLIETDLSATKFFLVNLSRAKLVKADLRIADINKVDFSWADLSGLILAKTILTECNLAHCKGLETIRHEGPSSISVDTIIETFRREGNCLTPEFKTFCLNMGVPKELLDVLTQALAEVKYYTCFVCYGSPDEAFAERLVADFRERGVSCWIYSMDATPGERTWREISLKRQEAEKFIVLCSARALVRDGVKKEIEEQIDEDPDKIIPISLDNIWKEEGFRVIRGSRDLKPFLLERNYADFIDESNYENSLNRLLSTLRRRN